MQAKKYKEQGKRFVSKQMAIYGKSGVKFEGSPAMVYAQTEKNISEDAIMIRLNAASKANQQRYQALQARMAAGRARTASYQELGSGVLDMGKTFLAS